MDKGLEISMVTFGTYGLEELHCLMQRDSWKMRIDYEVNGTDLESYLHYTTFRVETSAQSYQMVIGGFQGIGKNLLVGYNNRVFSTAESKC